MRQEYSAGSAGFILGSLPRCKTKCHQTKSYMVFGGLLRISFVRSIQPWKQTKTGTEVPSLTFLRRILQPHPHVPHVQDRPRHQEERKFKRPFPPTPSPPACHPARRARAGGAPPSSVRRRRPPASAARMGAWGRRGGAFGVAALGGTS